MEYVQLTEILSNVIPKEDIYINEPMSKHTSFKVGGNADLFIVIKDIGQIKYLLENVNKYPITIIGNGSNILVRSKGIRGIVLKILSDKYIINKDGTITVDSGMTNGKLAQILLKEGLSGFEFASTIPGTIGGSVKMNAGAYCREMSEIVKSTTYIDLNDNKIKTIENKQHNFSYRHSIFNENKAIILQTTLELTKKDKVEIENKMKKYIDKRRETQPIEYLSAGSTFKRGKDYITAELIDKCGLKGYEIGGAQVSTKHAGFIINKNNATPEDIINLIHYVENEVYKKFNKKIELEIEIIGEK